MRGFQRFFPVALFGVVSIGCGGGGNATDAGVLVDLGTSDGAAGNDAGSDGGTSVDGGGIACTPACGADHACVRGVCIVTCGADVSGFESALAAGLSVVGSVCRTPAALGFAGGHVYELESETSGAETTFTLVRWSPGSETPTATTVGTAHYTATMAEMVYTGGYVAVSDDEMHAVFGYTTSITPGYVGGVFDLATGSGTATELPADSNFGAAFGDATHYYVDGALGGTQGLYRAASGDASFAQVVTGLGDASGSVAYWRDEDLLLAGGSAFASTWADGMMGDRVLVLDPAALASATSPIDGATVTQLDAPSAFVLLPGGRLATLHFMSSAPYAVDEIDVRTLSRASGGALSVGTASPLTTGASFGNVSAAGSDIVLWFEGGLLFVH